MLKIYYLCGMETIFDHNPTPAELTELGKSEFSKSDYLKIIDLESAWVGLALLFRIRKDRVNESRAWSHVPSRRDEFLRGFDVIDLD